MLARFVVDTVTRRRNSLFGHVVRLDERIAAHRVLTQPAVAVVCPDSHPEVRRLRKRRIPEICPPSSPEIHSGDSSPARPPQNFSCATAQLLRSNFGSDWRFGQWICRRRMFSNPFATSAPPPAAAGVACPKHGDVPCSRSPAQLETKRHKNKLSLCCNTAQS